VDWRYTLPRDTFERQLGHLEDRVLALGSLVEKALVESVRVLKHRDMKRGRRLIAGDQTINEQRYAIEADTLALIATQQPAASHLRALAAILEIVTELERIGDYAKGIARINELIGEQELIKPIVDLPRMAQEAQDMLQQALDAFMRRDVELARAIPERDDLVDELYKQVFRELMTLVIAQPNRIEQSNYLLWAAHNLERAADRVTNICERVVFTITGEMTEMDPEVLGIEGVT
jgi:phosphate transport system protein